jgi:hypothetical protein
LPAIQKKATPVLLAWLLFFIECDMHAASLNALLILRCAVVRRWVALAFLLSVAAAYANPLIQPVRIDVLCSTSGVMKLISQTADGQPNSDTTPHCGLCAPVAAPPPAALPSFHSALAYAMQRTPESALASSARPPLPARGPPLIS